MDHRPAPHEEVPIVPRSRRALWLACWEGREPAERLDSRDREDLVWHLVQRGWTDLEIAEHTCMTLYTTVRIKHRLMRNDGVRMEEVA